MASSTGRRLFHFPPPLTCRTRTPPHARIHHLSHTQTPAPCRCHTPLLPSSVLATVAVASVPVSHAAQPASHTCTLCAVHTRTAADMHAHDTQDARHRKTAPAHTAAASSSSALVLSSSTPSSSSPLAGNGPLSSRPVRPLLPLSYRRRPRSINTDFPQWLVVPSYSGWSTPQPSKGTPSEGTRVHARTGHDNRRDLHTRRRRRSPVRTDMQPSPMPPSVSVLRPQRYRRLSLVVLSSVSSVIESVTAPLNSPHTIAAHRTSRVMQRTRAVSIAVLSRCISSSSCGPSPTHHHCRISHTAVTIPFRRTIIIVVLLLRLASVHVPLSRRARWYGGDHRTVGSLRCRCTGM
jgi:hypothetical protein